MYILLNFQSRLLFPSSSGGSSPRATPRLPIPSSNNMLRKSSNKSTPPTPSPPPPSADWEVLPGGMLVQKRILGAASAAFPPPSIRIRVKHGLAVHEIYISPQSTFGEVNKLLWEKTGIHPREQRLLFKERDRDSLAYLDTAGVKDGSRMIMEEDLTARAKRLLEMRRAAQAERVAKSLAAITVAIDGPVSKVSEMEAAVSRGESVAEKEVAELIELLMAQLLRLDAISVEETEAKRQRGIQVRRVQRNVEKLDMVKLKNSHSMHSSVNMNKQQQQQRLPVVVTFVGDFRPRRRRARVDGGACDLIAIIKYK